MNESIQHQFLTSKFSKLKKMKFDIFLLAAVQTFSNVCTTNSFVALFDFSNFFYFSKFLLSSEDLLIVDVLFKDIELQEKKCMYQLSK